MKRKILGFLLLISVAGVGIRMWQMAKRGDVSAERTERPRVVVADAGPRFTDSNSEEAAAILVQGDKRFMGTMTTLDDEVTPAFVRVRSTRSLVGATPEVAAAVRTLADETEVQLEEQRRRLTTGQASSADVDRAVEQIAAHYRLRWVQLTGKSAEEFDSLSKSQ